MPYVGGVAVQVHVLGGYGRDVEGSFRGGVGSVFWHHVPIPEVLPKGGGIMEHVGHVGYLRDVPGGDVLVEGGGGGEHGAHVSHLRDVPARDVPVEGGGAREHARACRSPSRRPSPRRSR